MSDFEIYLTAYLVIMLSVFILWLVSLALKNSSIVDIFWGTGFIITNAYYFAQAGGNETRKLLIFALVILWGGRLSLHLLWRNGLVNEDFRYRNWREQAGKSYWWRSFWKVFWLQGSVMWLVSAPLFAANISNTKLNLLDYLGASIWLIGFLFEAVGDFQLARFKANPANKGRVMDSGLWHYTRHPNYFGDAVVWVGFYLIALAAGGWWSIYGPALMIYLLMKVSGVAMLERTLVETKPQYREYIQRTNAFFPGIPKKGA